MYDRHSQGQLRVLFSVRCSLYERTSFTKRYSDVQVFVAKIRRPGVQGFITKKGIKMAYPTLKRRNFDQFAVITRPRLF